MAYVCVAMTVILTVYGQLVIKWRVGLAGAFPEEFAARAQFLLSLLANPWVASGLAAAVLAAMSWMVALTRLQLSHAYPFMGLAFAFVLLLSGVLLGESLTWQKVVGVALIAGGVILSGQT